MSTLSRFIKATKDQIFALLADYNGYADWTADVVESTVLVQEGDIVVAEFFSPELMEDKYVLELVHSKPISITYKQVDQYGSRGLRGSWHLADSPDGGGVIVTGEMNLKTSLWKSFSNRKKVNLILQRRLDVIQQMFSPIASAKEEGLPVAESEFVRGTEMLEAIQVGEELAVWFLGHKYLVKKAR